MAVRTQKRRYHIRTKQFIEYIIRVLKNVSPEDKLKYLDGYEIREINNTRKFAETANIEEIMVVMMKVGNPLTLVGHDKFNKHTERKEENYIFQNELKKGRSIKELTDTKVWEQARKFNTDRDVNRMFNFANKHKFFVLSGRDMQRSLALFSQLMNGSLYVPNHDFKTLIKIAHRRHNYHRKTGRLLSTDVQMMKVLLEVFSNIFISKDINGLNFDDYAFLFLLARNDDYPMPMRRINDILGFKKFSETIRRTSIKLTREGMIELYYKVGGVKNDEGVTSKKSIKSYSLTDKGWRALDIAIKSYFHGVHTWRGLEDEPNQNIDNGTVTINKKSSVEN